MNTMTKDKASKVKDIMIKYDTSKVFEVNEQYFIQEGAAQYNANRNGSGVITITMDECERALKSVPVNKIIKEKDNEQSKKQ